MPLEPRATRIYMEGGQIVRAAEPMDAVADMLDAIGDDFTWLPVADPGDERVKLIRRDRILWIEQELGDD